ncbi:MAG: DUF3822 family protein [Bacteroidia bacterium]|nr:DUF3822 family protein [Bacteroidia bacterium]
MSLIYKSYHHQSTNFNPEKMGEYSLAVFLKKGLLIYSILSGEEKILAVKEYRTKDGMETDEFLQSVLQEEKINSDAFNKVRVIYGVDDFSLLPSALFDRKYSKEFAQILIKDETDADHIDIRELKQGNAVAIYTIPNSLKKHLDNHFSNPEYEPFCLSAIEMGFELAHENKNLLLVNIFEQQFVITGIRDGNLHLCNAYPFREASDIVYFVQLAAEVLKLQPGTFQVFLAGEFENDSHLLNQLRKFIPSLQIPASTLKKTFDGQNDKLPAWKYAFMSF